MSTWELGDEGMRALYGDDYAERMDRGESPECVQPGGWHEAVARMRYERMMNLAESRESRIARMREDAERLGLRGEWVLGPVNNNESECPIQAMRAEDNRLAEEKLERMRWSEDQ